MKRDTINRRDFHKLTSAAFGGLVAGSIVGCGGGDAPAGKKDGKDGKETADASPLLSEPHVCRGLNACKGKGKGGDNTCAGQGACATAKEHDCHTMNECKGQGGCGEKPGENSCKGEGKCAVPLSEDAWKKARARFEGVMQEAGNEVGAAPEG